MDGLGSYQRAYRKEYRNLYNDDAAESVYINEIRIAGRIHNNEMEGLNEEIRDREKTFRGLKRSDTLISSRHRIFHNL